MKLCSVENCGKKHKSKGYCNLHLNRFKRTGSAELIKKEKPKKIRAISKCNYEGCLSLKKWGGFCRKHYEEIVLNIEKRPYGIKLKKGVKRPKIIKDPCYVDDCENYSKVKGLCSKHYARLKRHGDVNINYANNNKKTVKRIINKPLEFTHYYEETMILNEFFSEAIGLMRHEID